MKHMKQGMADMQEKYAKLEKSMQLNTAEKEADLVQRRANLLKELPFSSLDDDFDLFWEDKEAVKSLLLDIKRSISARANKKSVSGVFGANTLGKIFTGEVLAHMYWGVSSK